MAKRKKCKNIRKIGKSIRDMFAKEAFEDVEMEIIRCQQTTQKDLDENDIIEICNRVASHYDMQKQDIDKLIEKSLFKFM
jgi:hypothetical protein